MEKHNDTVCSFYGICSKYASIMFYTGPLTINTYYILITSLPSRIKYKLNIANLIWSH